MTENSLPISQTPAAAPAEGSPPAYPEGADLLVRAAPHDQQFWDRHPRVDRYRVVVAPEHADDPEWQVLLWLRPSAAPLGSTDQDGDRPPPPGRPADLDLVFDTTHEAALLADHPDVVAAQPDLQVNGLATGAERRLRLWLRDA